MQDLIIDPQIRTWVFLPVSVLTFLAGILRHYLQVLLKSDKPIELDKVKESQTLIRSQLLRKHGNFLTESSFNVRKTALINNHLSILEENKPLVNQPFEGIPEHHSALKEMMFTNVINFMPMVVIGSWCMYTLSGFILTKIPFPLTMRYKSMLQKDIFLRDLSAEWVSSASWYFLNVCGLRGFYYMLLGDHFISDQYMETAATLPQNTSAIFKNEIEALTMHKHNYCINDEIE